MAPFVTAALAVFASSVAAGHVVPASVEFIAGKSPDGVFDRIGPFVFTPVQLAVWMGLPSVHAVARLVNPDIPSIWTGHANHH